MALLEVRGLEKWYGRRQVVNGVDFDVNLGEVVGLLGPNGAGKTTSFRMTIGLIDSDGGSVLFDGQDISRMEMYKRARAGMGYLAQDSSVFKLLSVEDNLMAILETRSDLTRKQRKDRQNDLLDRFGLTHIRKTKANRVSGGERRRLEIARSLITEPKLIMLDEPFAGIDPKTVAEIQDQIRDLAEKHHIGILLTDHQFRETLEVTDRCYLIREGRVFAYGDREQIVNNPDVRRYYIGERFDASQLLQRANQRSLHNGRDGDGCELRLMPSVNDVAGIPTAGKKLIIVAVVGQVLHFRVFDGEGKMVVDSDANRLTAQARPIEELTKQLESLWPPHEVTESEKVRVVAAVASIVGHTLIDHGDDSAPPLPADHDGPPPDSRG